MWSDRQRPDRAVLLLQDGRRFDGFALGRRGIAVGELCFNTSLSGYQEILTDPSYSGQLVTLTYPEQGNTGTNARDLESRRVHAAGLVVRESSPVASSWRSEATLEAFLISQGTVGIRGVDTRALTRHLRDQGAQNGVIVSPSAAPDTVEAGRVALRAAPDMNGLDLASRVTCAEPHLWNAGVVGVERPVGSVPRVVAYDFGAKENILRHLISTTGAEVTVVPSHTSAEAALALRPDGVFLSNGPGDPAAVTGAIRTVERLLGKVPIFGICLGHQILALALGGRTYKLKFGHRGGNQPVQDLRTGKVEITSQNHGFAVDDGALPTGAVITHRNLNDGTVEGLAHAELRAYAVQYHPEASPGPHDAHVHFRTFRAMMTQPLGT